MKSLNRKKKILIGILTPVGAVILAFAVLCIVTMSMFSPTYLGRVLIHWDSSVSDYKIFPERVIKKGDIPYVYEKSTDNNIGNLSVANSTLYNFVKRTDTTSFIIVKNDRIVYEQYANGYAENSVNTSFSMAKSVVSLLIGKAIEDGYIKSVNEPISSYIGEFKDKKIGGTTIEELLSMRSEIAYDEDKFLWFGDDSLTYWYDDLKELALTKTTLTDEYNGKFHYNNFHPLLLGIILERTTKMSVSQYFEREIWSKIGAEHDAGWSLDSEDTGFEKMESGINFHAVDFLKIGSMVLHDGFWHGTQIIDSEWLKTSTLCDINAEDYKNTFLDGKGAGYKYMWYCTAEKDIVAWGKSDQILYISPSTDTVVLRTGKSDGGVSNWLNKIKEIIKQV